MMKSTSSAVILVLTAAIGLYLPGRAGATLGESARSVAADQRVLGGELRTFSGKKFQTEEGQRPFSTSNSSYTVDQLSTAAGIIVNEYISADGTVFAVSWRGPRPPNLSQLLGSYFTQYQTAAASPHTLRRGLLVQTPKLVVETSGHMRDLHGRAYVPGLLPPGFNPDEIQ